MIKRSSLFALVGASVFTCACYANAASINSPAEYVYVETNIKTTNGNSIAAFVRGTNGQLTEIQGSPFLTGGAGIQDNGLDLGPYDSDQNIVTNSDHTLLFAVNGGSDSIAVFHIEENGALEPVHGSPFPSGGNDPVSLGLIGNTLFVVNKAGDLARTSTTLPNYTTLRVENDGKLTPFQQTANDSTRAFPSTVSVALGSSPSQALVIPGTNLMFGADFLGGLIQSFSYDLDGGLHQLPPLALPVSEFPDATTPRLVLGLSHHPNLPLLYVGYTGANKLGVYQYGFNGSLKFIRAVPNAGQAICWIRINQAGTRLYTSETTTNSIGAYDLSNPEVPEEFQELPLADTGSAVQFSLSSDEHYIYALSSRGVASIPEGQGNELHILTVDREGRLSENISPVIFHLPPDTRPQGVAVVPIP
jgi:hypothetical protein